MPVVVGCQKVILSAIVKVPRYTKLTAKSRIHPIRARTGPTWSGRWIIAIEHALCQRWKNPGLAQANWADSLERRAKKWAPVFAKPGAQHRL